MCVCNDTLLKLDIKIVFKKTLINFLINILLSKHHSVNINNNDTRYSYYFLIILLNTVIIKILLLI